MILVSTNLAAALLLSGLAVPAQAQGPMHVGQQGESQGTAREADASNQSGADQETKPMIPSFDQLLRDRLDLLEARIDSPGTSQFLVTGFGVAGFRDEQGSHSTFGAQLNPIFLWEISDRLFFESELELELEGEEAAVHLEYATLSYLINDYMAFELGKFLTPLSHFLRDQHPAWINKLPARPLYTEDEGIVPEASIGAQLTGAFPIGTGPSKVEYSTWVENGPALVLAGEDAGHLEFSNSVENNTNKTVGVRLGFSPTESLNLGAAGEYGRVNAPGDGAGDVSAVVAAADLTYIDYCAALRSTFDFRTEYAYSHVQDPDVPYLDDMGAPLPSFDNTRDGAFFQLGVRPTQSEVGFVQDLELVARYDFLDGISAAGIPDLSQVTLGIDWWVSPQSVAKVAYRIDTSDRSAGRGDAFLFQWAFGF